MYLMWLKEYVTPDFFHFVMCLGEDATHSIWIIFLWLTFKCYLSKPTSHQHVPDNLYQVLTFLEGLVGLLLAGELRISTLFIFTSATALLMLRLRNPESMNTPIFYFIFIYLSQNFIANSLDYLLFRNLRTYYHDDHFLLSFSYKVFQFAICALLSLLFGWSFVPPF